MLLSLLFQVARMTAIKKMSKWTQYKVGEVCSAIYSGGTPSTSNDEYWDGDYFWLSSGETSSRYITKTEKTITQKGINNSSTKLAKSGSLVMACAGQGKTRGQASILKCDTYINQSIIAMVGKTELLDTTFLFYNMLLRYDELRMRSDANSIRGSITTDMLKKLPISIPDLPTQKRIADILTAYDDLIENNKCRLELLEKAAQELYKEWFVRFRFPGHETAKFENGIPKGWTRDRISRFYNTTSGGTPSRANDENYEGGTIPWIKTGELQDCIIIDTEEKITEDAIKKSSAKIFPKDSVLMAMYGVNIGMLAYSAMDAACNQACCVFKDKGKINTKHYLFQYLKSIRDYLLLIGFGAAQQNLSQDLIRRIKIVMPDNETLLRFEQTIEPIYSETKLLLKANAQLTRQRDLLLPRLMSGKLQV